jgi:ABC-type microcin C transport system permease subunit YejB
MRREMASRIDEARGRHRSSRFESLFGVRTVVESAVSSMVFAVLLLLFILTSGGDSFSVAIILGMVACSGLLFASLISLVTGLGDRGHR